MEESKDLIPFEGKPIRKIWHNEEWYFSVVDVIEVLTDSKNPNRYWTDLKRRTEKESGQSYAFCVSLKLKGSDGKNYKTDCANTEGVFRIIMSVPSPKAEPLKMWMAQVSKERIEETENPELSFERMTEIYKAKGFNQNQEAAAYGGTLAGGARAKLEKDKGIKVVSTANFLRLDDGKSDELLKEDKAE